MQRDVEVREVEVKRWRCGVGRRTVWRYPEGVRRAQQTARLRVLVAMGWDLELSLQSVVWWLATTLGVRIGVTTAFRDVRAVVEAVR